MKFLGRRLPLFIIMLTASSLIFSCATNGTSGMNATAAVLRGMVYNVNRMPVLDMKVSLLGNGKTAQSALTDVHGRYLIPDVPFGPVSLRFTKDGYEPLEWSFSFTKPTEVVYVQVVDLNELLDRAAESIEKGNWAQATSYLGRVRRMQPDQPVATYLEAEMVSRQGNPTKAAVLLEKLSSGHDSSLAIELALADLYQYKLDQDDKALAHLKKARAIQSDIDIENRITALEKN